MDKTIWRSVAVAAVVSVLVAGAPATAGAEDAPEGEAVMAAEVFSDVIADVENPLAPDLAVEPGGGGATSVTGDLPVDGGDAVQVQLTLPASTTGDVAFVVDGEPAVAINLPGTGDPANQISDHTVAYEGETPTLVTAVSPTAVETFHVVTSSSAPAEYRTSVDLPPGHELVLGDGGLAAVVDANGAPVVFVEAPWALDAAGVSVPLSLSVEGNEVVVSVDHQSADVAYPVLVDPIWYYYGYGYYMNDAEFSWCKWPSRWGLCKAMSDHASAATAAAQSSGLSGAHNGRQDAFRHCYWNARMRIGHGQDKAKEFADRHEESPGQPSYEKTMDLNNNAIGRNVGYYAVRDHGSSRTWALNECKRRANAGQLWIIRNNQAVMG